MMDIGRELSYRMQAGFKGIMVHVNKIIQLENVKNCNHITVYGCDVVAVFLSERQPIFYSYCNEEVHL